MNTAAFASWFGCGDGNTSMSDYNQGAGSYAARLCFDLSSGGYSDWYLPSKYETSKTTTKVVFTFSFKPPRFAFKFL
jgi:hypothetical protein